MDTVWDPLRKKQVAATPEERVRQWFIMQLNQTFWVPMHMMRSEVGLEGAAKSYRADIVVFSRSGKPLAVVECKKSDVRIDSSVSDQALRYAAPLGVQFLMLTNGKKTYIYTLEEGRFVPCDHIPSYEEMICRQ